VLRYQIYEMTAKGTVMRWPAAYARQCCFGTAENLVSTNPLFAKKLIDQRCSWRGGLRCPQRTADIRPSGSRAQRRILVPPQGHDT